MVTHIKVDWKQNSLIENMIMGLETKFEGENSESIMKTQIVDWKQIRLKTY